MLRIKFLAILRVFVFSAMVCASLHAIMVKIPLPELTMQADTIVVADVLGVECQWSWDRRTIQSIVTLRVGEVLKGKIDRPEILIQVPGGRVGEISLRVSDMPAFAAGERVLIFLSEIPDRQESANSPAVGLLSAPAFHVLGAAQGKYRIEPDGRAWKYGYDLLKASGEEDKSLPLSDLKGMIRNILNRNSRSAGK